jgi:ubiquinol-cytochrome c reductase cytochrome b subunit
MDYDYWAKAGQRGKGAELDAAADRDTPNYPARPEWYFLFLFQLLKYFEGPLVEVGTVYIPNGVGVLLALLPLLGYGPLRKFGHFVGILVVVALIICAGLLTGKALMDDRPEGIVFGLLKNSDPKLLKDAEEFQKSVHAAEVKAKRACQLAMAGTPVEGGHMLMRNDPFTAGQELFKTKCASCHNFTRLDSDKDMHGEYRFESMTTGTKASDLGDFGKKTWILGLLKDPLGAKHFGLVKRPLLEDGKPKKDAKNRIILQQAFDGMDEWRKDILYVRTEEKWNDAEIAAQEKDFEDIADWLIDQAKPRDQRDMKLVDLGQKAFFNGEKNKCSGCHKVEKGQPVEGKKDKWTFEKAGASTGPDLSNYASADWIRGMILSPYHRSRYGKNNLMPVFRNLDAPGAEVFLDDLRGAAKDLPNDMIQHLTDIEREMIIRWMLRDYRPVFGGAPPK